MRSVGVSSSMRNARPRTPLISSRVEANVFPISDATLFFSFIFETWGICRYIGILTFPSQYVISCCSHTEGWLSGLKHRLGKAASGKPDREFESRPLRNDSQRRPGAVCAKHHCVIGGDSNAGAINFQQKIWRGGAQTNLCDGKGLVAGESRPLRQLGNERVGSPARRARQPFFGEISSRFEFSKAKSGLFFSELKELNNFAIIVL